MENKRLEVTVEASDLRNYMFCHKYKRVIGVVELLIGVGCLIGGIVGYRLATEDWRVYTLFLIFFGVYFLVICPIQTFTNSARQYLNNPTYQKPMVYELGEEGIKISQEKDEAFLPWGEVFRVVDNGKSIVIYISKLNANILPKRCFSEQVDEVKDIFKQHLDENRVRL